MKEHFDMSDSSIATNVAQPLLPIFELPEHAEWIAPGEWVLRPVFGHPGEIVARRTIDTDFLDTLIRFLGAKRDRARIWRVFGMPVTWRNSLGIVGFEEGWRRYRLTSLDGVTRHNDSDAPVLMLTPRGQAIFQLSSRHKVRPLNSLAELADFVLEHAPVRGCA